MKVCAILNVWNSSLWIEYQLRQLYPFCDRILIDELNYTSQEKGWRGKTSPDGTAELIRAFPDPEGKITFRQLGYWDRGVLAARAELCRQVPKCDWVYVADHDEFQRQRTIGWLQENLEELTRRSYTTISQTTRSFYYDFTLHTIESSCRIHRWYPGFDAWSGRAPWSKDFHIPREFGEERVSTELPQSTLFHYSYVPVPAVATKGAQTFDVSCERYQTWYREVYRQFDGTNLEELYAKNGGGVHVFQGMPLQFYRGEHPEVLSDHPLRGARWSHGEYLAGDTGEPLALNGWWNR